MSSADTAHVTEAILARLKLDPDTPSNTPVTQEAGRLWAAISNLSSNGKPVLYPINAIFVLFRELPTPTFQDLMDVIDAHAQGYAAAYPFLEVAINVLSVRLTDQPA